MTEVPGGPRLRPVEAFPATVDGHEVVCLRDPSGVTPDVLTASRSLLEILALFDGEHSLLDIQAEIMGRHGTLVLRSELEALVERLDERLFLEGARLDAERARLAAAFQASAVRPAAHAGRAYAGEAGALGEALAGYFSHPEGPGSVGAPGSTVLHGLVAPHIDFHRGGPAYAWAYRAVAEARDADCFIVLGTAHAGLDGHPLAATRKAYDTPFGPVPVDEEVLDLIARRSPTDLFAAELAHRTEHSIEFQAVCLRYVAELRKRDAEARIVPLLASFVHECLVRGTDPAQEPPVAGGLDAIREVMAVVPRRYCVVAAADLAHMGPRFGDPRPVSRAELAQIEVEDRALLGRVAAGDPAGFLDDVRRDGDRRRTCGLSPLYATLRLLAGRTGRLLSYGQWPDPQGVVTFASLAFAEDPA